jgi:hypothetical protein
MASTAGRWHHARAQFSDELVADEGEATFEGVQRLRSVDRHVMQGNIGGEEPA